jgi:hypothetical protein
VQVRELLAAGRGIDRSGGLVRVRGWGDCLELQELEKALDPSLTAEAARAVASEASVAASVPFRADGVWRSSLKPPEEYRRTRQRRRLPRPGILHRAGRLGTRVDDGGARLRSAGVTPEGRT